MSVARILGVGLLTVVAGSGCISISMDDVDQYKNVERPNFRQVTSLKVDRIEPEFVKQGAMGYYSGKPKLKLCAVGEFIEHGGIRTERINVGRRTLAIGLCPGMEYYKECYKGTKAADSVFMSLLMNCLWVGIPTVSSLLVEPFCDYTLSMYAAYLSGKERYGIPFSDYGLMGCRKYYRGGKCDGKPIGFRETNRKNCSRVELYGFAVSVNGKRYAAADDGAVWLDGVKAGDRLRVQVLEAPLVRDGSTDKMTELVGTEFELTVP